MDGNCNIVQMIVGIEESSFTKSRRSYHAHVTPRSWLFSDIECGTQKSFLMDPAWDEDYI